VEAKALVVQALELDEHQSSASASISSVRSPPSPRLPVSIARCAVVARPANISRSPATARRQTVSQSAWIAEG
jgi:hypothetical protein